MSAMIYIACFYAGGAVGSSLMSWTWRRHIRRTLKLYGITEHESARLLSLF